MAAAFSGTLAFCLLSVPEKLQAEPNLVGLLALPMFIAAAVWLAAAVLRHWLLSLER
jgi:hypothetical protein